MRTTITILLLSSLILISCSKKNKWAPDPCADSKPFVGGFDFFQEIADTTINDDTLVAAYTNFGFKVKGDYRDSLLWEFNNRNSTAATNKFVMEESLAGTQVKVTLSQLYKAHPNCFPGETGQEKLTKTAVIVPLSSSKLIGHFKGVNSDNTNDTFTIHITYFEKPYKVIYLSNLPKGCTKTINLAFPPESGYQVAAGYKFLRLQDQSSCAGQLNGYGKLISQDSIQINYKYYESPSSTTFTTKIFKGKRLP